MKVFIIFFLILAFNLLGMQRHAQGQPQNTRCNTRIATVQQMKASNLQTDDLCAMEEDDDDNKNSDIAKKQLSTFVLAFYHQLMPGHPEESLRRLPFRRNLSFRDSCIYISQRVLRI